MSNGGPAFPVWIVPSEELLRNGGTIPVQGGAAVPFTFDGSLEPGQVPEWDGSAFVGVTPVTNGLLEPMPNAVPLTLTIPNLPSGTTQIYTVPVGYSFIGFLNKLLNPTSGALGSGIFGLKVLHNTVDLYVGVATTIAARSENFGVGCVANGADVISVVTNAAGLVVSVYGYLVPDTEIERLKPIFSGLGNGNNVVYTCPTGKTARVIPFGFPSGTSTRPYVIYNVSGNTRIYSVYAVPSGGSPDNTNLIASHSVANGAANTGGGYFSLSQGDTFVISSDSADASQACWFLVDEQDA